MALTTLSSSYALLQQPHRLIVGNPCIPCASAIASKDLRFGNGLGRDRFVLTAGSGRNLITDLTKGEDLVVLASCLTFAQLSITQNANSAFIRIGQNNQLLAALKGAS